MYTHTHRINQWLEYDFLQHISLRNKKVFVDCALQKKKNGKRKQSVLQHVKDQIFLSVTLAQADTDNTLQYYSATTWRKNINPTWTRPIQELWSHLYPRRLRDGLFYYYGSKSNQMSLYLHLTHTKLTESLCWRVCFSQFIKACSRWHTGLDIKLERPSVSCCWGDPHGALYFLLVYLSPSFKLLLSCFSEFLMDH